MRVEIKTNYKFKDLELGECFISGPMKPKILIKADLKGNANAVNLETGTTISIPEKSPVERVWAKVFIKRTKYNVESTI